MRSRHVCSTGTADWWAWCSRAARRQRRSCCRRLKVITHAPSLAGVESLISEPRLTSHKPLTAEERASQGVPDGFLRLSCGCEDAEDLIDDLAGALK